jgi:hypothetical protein
LSDQQCRAPRKFSDSEAHLQADPNHAGRFLAAISLLLLGRIGNKGRRLAHPGVTSGYEKRQQLANLWIGLEQVNVQTIGVVQLFQCLPATFNASCTLEALHARLTWSGGALRFRQVADPGGEADRRQPSPLNLAGPPSAKTCIQRCPRDLCCRSAHVSLAISTMPLDAKVTACTWLRRRRPQSDVAHLSWSRQRRSREGRSGGTVGAWPCKSRFAVWSLGTGARRRGPSCSARTPCSNCPCISSKAHRWDLGGREPGEVAP